MSIDLALVMPVYNEQDCIEGEVISWRDMLARLGISFRMILLNDGSRDATSVKLSTFEDDARIMVINKPNSGHGPTILQGYHTAVDLAQWIFQCDSDGEMKPDNFPALWEKRELFDALFGIRSGRNQNIARKTISFFSRFTVRLLFGPGVSDVNTPYRLIRSDILKRIIAQIPNDTFAPNVIISGTLSKAGARIFEKPVPHTNRKTGSVSIVKWRLWKSAILAWWQTMSCRPKIGPLGTGKP